MNIVPFRAPDKDAKPFEIPDIPESLYGDLFFAASWVVLSTPWKKLDGNLLFELSDETGEGNWEAYLNKELGLCVFSLVSGSDRLEIRFQGSEFLQGHDYDLNVRYAPDAWDACEMDVIVLRTMIDQQFSEYPLPEHIVLMTEGLRKLKEVGQFL